MSEFGAMCADDLRQRIETALHETKQAVAEHDAEQAATRADHLKTILQEAWYLHRRQRATPVASAPAAVGATTS